MGSTSYNSIHLINKGMYHAIGIVLFSFILDVQGSLRNTQCKRTQDWNSYQFQCSKDHTIYFKHHIIEDGFQMLSYSDTFLGCKETDAVYCGTKLPINQTLGQNSAAFVSAVSDCNGKIKCNVSGQYFKDIEASVRKLCSQSSHPELNKASFRQSIEYECIQDYQVIEMCTNRRDSRSPHAYLQSSGDGGNCSCEMTGNISRLEILQTAMAELLISNESSPLFEHQNSDVSLYGVEVPVITKKLLIHIQGRSAASRILIKVLGNLTIHCDELKSTSAVQYQGHVSTVLSFTETRQIGKQMVKESSTESNMTGMEISKSSMDSPYTSTQTDSHNRMDSFKSSVAADMSKDTDTKQNKAEMRSLFLVLAAVILLIIFQLLLSVIQRRKDRDLLLAILHKLEESSHSNNEERHSEATETSRIPSSENEKNYQEIPLRFLNHANTKRLSNPVYDTDRPDQDNVCSEEQKVEHSMANSVDVQSDQFLLEKDNGIYDLQKSF